MRQMTVDDYVALPWVTREEALEDGMYRLTIDGLDDFEIFDRSSERVQKEWRIALHALLQGYLLVGKAIPVPPHAYISEMPPAWIPASPPIFLDEQGRPRPAQTA